MMTIVVLAALPAELLALFAIWNWRIRNRSIGWLIAGCMTLMCLAAITALLPTPMISRICLGFAGMYLVSALSWAWWNDRVYPFRWTLSEVGIAGLAVAFFAIASAR